MPRPSLLPTPAGLEFIGLEEAPDWGAVFGFEGPLELEIGCGAGGFALAYAQRHPRVRYVALEWRRKYARELERRVQRRELRNIRVIEADARTQVPRLFRPASLSAIHLQFPDPWWKRAHQKRAVLQPSFCQLLYELLEPGGLFDLRTDVEDRAQQMLHTLEEAGFVNPLGRGAFHPRQPEDIPSTRERRYLISEYMVYRANLRKPL
jgi:tRNA (guanine-N7-)-methyltransferase